MPNATQNNPKGEKETTKEGGISLTIMGQKSVYNSIHKPQRSPDETLELIRMTTHTECAMKQEQIPGIPMVVMVMSRAHSLCNPTQQDCINPCTLPIYKCHTCFKF